MRMPASIALGFVLLLPVMASAETITIKSVSGDRAAEAVVIPDSNNDDRTFVLSENRVSIDSSELIGDGQMVRSIDLFGERNGNSEEFPLTMQLRRCGNGLCRNTLHIAFAGSDAAAYDEPTIRQYCGRSPQREPLIVESYIYCRGAFKHLEKEKLLHWQQAELAAFGWFENSYRLAAARDRRTGHLHFLYKWDQGAIEAIRTMFAEGPRREVAGRTRAYYEGMMIEALKAESQKIQLADRLAEEGSFGAAILLAVEAYEAIRRLAENDPARIVNGISASDIEARITRWGAQAESASQPPG